MGSTLECRGLLQFPQHLSLHVAADTPLVRTAVSDLFRSVLVAFARYRPSQPPELRVTRLHLRSLGVTTWSFARAPNEHAVRGLHRLVFTSRCLSGYGRQVFCSRSDLHRLDVVSLAGHANRPALTINPDDCVVRAGQLRTPKGQPWLGFTPPVPYEDDFDRKWPCDCRECGDTQPD